MDMSMRVSGAKQFPARTGGLMGWLLARFRKRRQRDSRLEMLDRISLGPRQTLCLIEAEGQRFLVACAGDGNPAFQPLDSAMGTVDAARGRTSW